MDTTMDLWGWQSSMGHMVMDGDHCELMGLVVLGSPWIYGAGSPLWGRWGWTDTTTDPQGGWPSLGHPMTNGDNHGPVGSVEPPAPHGHPISAP